jgi:hypothetical protein
MSAAEKYHEHLSGKELSDNTRIPLLIRNLEDGAYRFSIDAKDLLGNEYAARCMGTVESGAYDPFKGETNNTFGEMVPLPPVKMLEFKLFNLEVWPHKPRKAEPNSFDRLYESPAFPDGNII